MTVPEIDIDGLFPLHAAGALLVDVRTPAEYEEAHVPGARLIPLPDVAVRVAEFPSGQPIYVICQTGVRSAKATEFLLARGLDATNVAGGTKAWIEAGNPAAIGSTP